MPKTELSVPILGYLNYLCGGMFEPYLGLFLGLLSICDRICNCHNGLSTLSVIGCVPFLVSLLLVFPLKSKLSPTVLLGPWLTHLTAKMTTMMPQIVIHRSPFPLAAKQVMESWRPLSCRQQPKIVFVDVKPHNNNIWRAPPVPDGGKWCLTSAVIIPADSTGRCPSPTAMVFYEESHNLHLPLEPYFSQTAWHIK